MSDTRAAQRLILIAKAAYEQAMLDNDALPYGEDAWEQQSDEVKDRWVRVVLTVMQTNRLLRTKEPR